MSVDHDLSGKYIYEKRTNETNTGTVVQHSEAVLFHRIYQECSGAGAPVKAILQRHGMNPWDLVAIRKKVREASLEALSHTGTRKRKKSIVPLEEFQKLSKELQDTKDALSAVGHEFSLLKKRVNSG